MILRVFTPDNLPTKGTNLKKKTSCLKILTLVTNKQAQFLIQFEPPKYNNIYHLLMFTDYRAKSQ